MVRPIEYRYSTLGEREYHKDDLFLTEKDACLRLVEVIEGRMAEHQRILGVLEVQLQQARSFIQKLEKE
jgi:hypothetical protein